MQGKPTLYYFNLYGRAEMIRMALHKAGVEFEDKRVSGDSWKELKESGKLEFGQVPMLELADGTQLVQSGAILNYIGAVYKLKHDDPMVCYNAQKCVDLSHEDYIMKHFFKAHF